MIGYKAEDIWNEDETGCFYRVLPDKSLSNRNKECKGGDPRKGLLLHSLPMLLVVRATNCHRESCQPYAFQGNQKSNKPEEIPYYANPKA